MTTTMSRRSTPPAGRRQANRTVLWIAFATGMGFIGALDAIGFHHLLRWHNLFVHAGADWRAISDGLLHVFSSGLLFAGFLLLWRQRRSLTDGHASGLALAAGLWWGMGTFQLIDGVLFHKVLALHPVREGVTDVLPYDLAWIASALALMAIGWALGRRVA